MDDLRNLTLSVTRRASLAILAGGAAGIVAGDRNVASRAQPGEDIAFYARRIRRSPFSERNVEAAVSAFALAGIAVYEHATDILPMVLLEGQNRSPLKLLLWQVRNMALQVSAGGGFKGSDLDAVFPAVEGVPPVSWLLAGYVAATQAPGGELARALTGDQVGEQAPEQIFSSFVLTLFVSDMAIDQQLASKALAVAPLSQPSGVCTAVQQFTSDVLSAVFDVLKVGDPQNKDSSLLTDIWNWIVGAGESVVEGLADILTAPVIAAIQAITGVLAIGTSISSMLQAWTVSVDSQPPNTRFGVDSEFITGKVAASIDAGGQEDWPAELANCADASGISLPSFRGEGATVTWKVTEIPIDLVQEMGKSPLVEDDGVAEYIYQTNNEPADVAEGIPLEGLCIVELWVERSDVAQLRDNLLAILTTNLPAPFGAAVEAVLGPAITSLTSDLAEVMVKGYGFDTVKVIYHEKQITVTPEPEEPPEPEGSNASCPVGVWYMSDFGGFFESLMAASGGAAMTYLGETGVVVFELRGDGTYTVTSDGFEAIFSDGIYSYVATLNGSESGTYAISEDQISATVTSGSMALTIVAEGFFETTIPFATIGSGGQSRFACEGGDLLLFPPTGFDIPVRWSPYEDS